MLPGTSMTRLPVRLTGERCRWEYEVVEEGSQGGAETEVLMTD